jgi:tetratricopeptide (TPR) repeat protein
MSEREEEVPELDAEAKSFLARHQQTGEPSPEALARVAQKLTAPAPAPEVKLASVTRLPQRRPMFPPEVKAAAAVVIVLLGAQATYLALRQREVVADDPYDAPQPKPAQPEAKLDPKTPDPQLSAVVAAWRAGDFDGARRLASRECSSAACGEVSGELAEMLDLARRVDQLSYQERDRLRSFDKKLSNGLDSVLQRRLDQLPPPDPETLASAKKLFDSANVEKKAKNFERAALGLEKCVKLAPTYYPCWRLMGSVYASIAARDQSAIAMERARVAYKQFLKVAPPDDEYVPKVAAILEAARTDDDDADERSKDSIDERPEGPLVSNGDTVRLGLGYQHVVTLQKPIARVAVGDTSIADVKTIGTGGLLIIGAGEGKTTVLVWDSSNDRLSFVVDVGSSDATPADDTVTMVSGGHTTIPFQKDITRVAIGDPNVSDVNVISAREIRLDARRAGKTNLLVWFAGGGRSSTVIEVKESNNFDDRVQALTFGAAMAQTRNEWRSAMQQLNELLRIDPKNAAGLKMKDDFRNQARDKYLRAYQLRDVEPREAMRLFREVVEMTDPGDETHERAAARYAELNAK